MFGDVGDHQEVSSELLVFAVFDRRHDGLVNGSGDAKAHGGRLLDAEIFLVHEEPGNFQHDVERLVQAHGAARLGNQVGGDVREAELQTLVIHPTALDV